MTDIVVSILTDATARDESAVTDAFMQQAVAIPWSSDPTT
jgi:hypothetical protein